jgi:hypothetical protein
MHPEILRQLIEQNSREARARAEENRRARQLISALRGQRRSSSADVYAIPAIPDYVDGSFMQPVAGEAKTGEHQVPAARNAA